MTWRRRFDSDMVHTKGFRIANTILKNANNPPVSLSRLGDYLRFKRIILGMDSLRLGYQLDQDVRLHVFVHPTNFVVLVTSTFRAC